MTQLTPTFGPPLAAGAARRGRTAPAEEAVAGTGLPVQVVSCGVPYLMVPLTTRAARGRGRAGPAGVSSAAGARRRTLGAVASSCSRPRPGADEATVYSRMFAPDIGITEDPATGSAAGPLGCYLRGTRCHRRGKGGYDVSLQGVRMGRPSVIHIAIASEAGTITRVRVGGEAVLAGEGTLYVLTGGI